MIRNGFAMQLLPGNEAEYKRRHDEIWPELSRELRASGIVDYVIYLDPRTLTLYASQHLAKSHTTEALPGKEIVCKWWDYMADLMETNPDNSPVVYPLMEVFSMGSME